MEMTRLSLALTLVLLSTQAIAATPTETVAAFHAAVAKGDLAAAKALLAPDVVIYESGHVERSLAEYAAGHLSADAAFAANVNRKILRSAERASGDLAVVTEETETSGNYKDKPVHVFGIETAVLQKAGDAWVIRHFHWSSRKAK